MKTFERKVTTTFRWRRDDRKDNPEGNMVQLAEAATDRINQLVSDGWLEGQLHDSFELDGEDIEYSGWWKWSKE